MRIWLSIFLQITIAATILTITGCPNPVATTAPSGPGSLWSRPVSGLSGDWGGVTYGSGLFVAIAHDIPPLDFSGPVNLVSTSQDGITWTSGTLPVYSFWSGVVYGNGLFAAFGNNSSFGTGANTVVTSLDGITWSTQTPTTFAISNVAYGNRTFVALRPLRLLPTGLPGHPTPFRPRLIGIQRPMAMAYFWRLPVPDT
jgi:hypothetical protein